jgi:hypothetical protein
MVLNKTKLNWKETPKNNVILIKAIKKYRPFEAGHGKKEELWQKVVDEVCQVSENTITKQTAKDNFKRLYQTFLKENPLNGEHYSGIVTLENTVSMEMQVLAGQVYDIENIKKNKKNEREAALGKRERNYTLGHEILEKSVKKQLNDNPPDENDHNEEINSLSTSQDNETYEGKTESPKHLNPSRKKSIAKLEMLETFERLNEANFSVGEKLLLVKEESLKFKKMELELKERELRIREMEIENQKLFYEYLLNRK